MQFDAALVAFGALHKQMGPLLDGSLLLFFRILSFFVTGPIFNRRNLPFMIKIVMAFLLTGSLFWMLSPEQRNLPAGYNTSFMIITVILNVIVGATIGFIASMILETLSTAGGLMNNQVGLSSAMMMDPSSGRQTMVMETLLQYIGTLLFIDIGGVHWMILALQRSVKIFPLYALSVNFPKVIDMSYLVTVSSNVLLVGVQLIAPAMIVTIAIDIMLGVVNRTAQQIPVFQLSFALKPAIGVALLYITLSTFIQTTRNFLMDYSHFF